MPLSKLFSRSTKEPCSSAPPQPLYFRLGNCTVPVASWYPSSITSISSWGLEAYIGVPSQAICLEASTTVNNVALMGSNICNGDNSGTFAQCVNRRGGLFNPADATSNFSAVSTSVLAPDPEWLNLNPPYASAADATFQFVSDISIPSLPIALVEDASNSSISQLGLSNDSVILHSLMNAGLSPANGFSFMPGSQSPTNWRDGHLIIGGYDRGSLAGPFTTFPINSTYTVGESSRACPLHVTVDGLVLSLPGQADIPLISAGTTMQTCIEPLDNLFRLPQDRLTQFQTLTNWNPNVTVPADIFVIEPGLYYNTPFEGNLTFSLENGPTVTIPASELSWQARGLNPSGQKVLVDNITVVNIFHDTAVEDTAVLGKVFLSQLMLAVNYQTQEFKIAQAITIGDTALDLVSFNGTSYGSCPSSSSSGLRTGLIVVGAILGLLILALLALLGLYLLGKRRKTQHPVVVEKNHDSNASLPTQQAEKEVGAKLILTTTSRPAASDEGRRGTVGSIISALTSRDDPISLMDGVGMSPHEMAATMSPRGRQELDSSGARVGPVSSDHI